LTYRKIITEVNLQEGLPLLSLDARRFKQALLNVIANASEAMPIGGTLTVDSSIDGQALAVRICDDGVGIDPAIKDRAFDPFITTKPNGVGLGLVNVKSVVEGHGGRIILEPRYPRGACVTIWLPLHRAAGRPAVAGETQRHG
jgi:signal transduction histidine kinase